MTVFTRLKVISKLLPVKSKIPVHVVNACRQSGGIAPLILNLDTRWI
jgi:hypothetical protein